VTPRDGLERARRRDGREGRFESEEIAFHERVWRAFQAIARREPGRVVVLDARAEKSAVADRAWAAVAERFARLVPA
jgi:dTMP kinase